MPKDDAPRRGLLQRAWSVVDPNERYLRTIQPMVARINALEAEFETLSQQDLKDRLRKIRGRVVTAREKVLAEQAQLPPAGDSDTRRKREEEVVASEKAILDEHLPEVFAAVREAAKRTLSMRHFDVQLLGGIVLHEGRISEMKTGEGKTLTATLPLVLNALAGRGAHLVTVNDYLARRDAEWMGKIYQYLGLSVGVIQHDLVPQQRQRAYAADITYITNHEIGFDYLRDNWRSFRPDQLVIRELYYAIIDEVDSILVDEARVPLIISAARGKPVEAYRRIQEVVSKLIQGEQDEESKEISNDFYVDEKAKNAVLSEDGQRKIEVALGIDNLNDSAHIEENHLVGAALKANFCYKRNVDYIVGPGDGGVPSVIIVDPFTGRPQPGRRWSDGLHQAIEAKERVPVQDEQQTVATVTYQNFFLMYHRLAGMTGTAKTEEAEFVDIYDMHVVVVPTNKPMIRRNHEDVVYKNLEWKLRGIACELVGLYCRRQPVLVGTRSVEASEQVSERLRPDLLRMALQMMLMQWHLIENEKRCDKKAVAEARQRSLAPLEDLNTREVEAILALLGLDAKLDSEANLARLMDILEITDQAALVEVIANGIPHEVLNARHHEREAQIVAQAGRLGAITIATNMAGRGTDIVLGGNPEPDVEELLYDRGIDPKSLSATLFCNAALKGDPADAERTAAAEGGLPRSVLDEIAVIRAAWQSEQRDVIAAGGLHILGTERHESRRIDNQLRGRSGRQGDPGAARFYVALEDELMRLFAPERFKLLQSQWPDEQPVEAKLISKSMSNAQRKVEGRNFEMRKNTLRYDDVMNVQRKHIYGERRRILEGYDLRETVNSMMGDLVAETMATYTPGEQETDEWDLPGLWAALNARFPLKDQLRYEQLRGLPPERLKQLLTAAAERSYDERESDFIRAVVEFELQASTHETLRQVADRQTVCAVLTTLWPLAEVLPSGLDGVPDGRVPETILQLARESLERGPREFALAVARDRVARDAAGDLRAWWPIDAPDAAAAQAIVDQRGWPFILESLRWQIQRTTADALPATCDLDRLVAELAAMWPLGAELDAEKLATCNYGVIVDRLQRLAQTALESEGWGFLERAAAHRLQLALAEARDLGGAGAMSLLRGVLGPTTSLPDGLWNQPDDAVLAQWHETAVDALILAAVEEVAAHAVGEAHRQSAATGGEDGEEEKLEYGDLQRVLGVLNQHWALGDALNAWELERLPTVEQRREMVDQIRGEVRARGRVFVDATAHQRFAGSIAAALAEHFSLGTVCARLAQEFQLPGTFEPRRYAEVTTPDELIAALMQTASELDMEPEWTQEFGRSVRARVAESFNLQRLCERLNQELKPNPPLTAKELTGVPGDELEAVLGERLEATFDEYAHQFIVDCVREHLLLSIENALTAHYDLRTLSSTVAAAWPVDSDAVRASKLKGWAYRELAKRLEEVLLEAAGAEPWRFIRRMVVGWLERGLREATDRFVPDGARRAEWNLQGLADDLADRWPLPEPIDWSQAVDAGREPLGEWLMDHARLAYQQAERRFVRETARHRFAQQLDRVQQTHYSLSTACDALGRQWNIPGAIQPAELAAVRDLLRRQPGAVEAEVGRLVEPHLEQAEVALLQAATERRIADSVDDVLRRSYNTSELVEALLGRWQPPEGGISPVALRAMPYRELIDSLRKLLTGADGPLRRRVVFWHLRQSAADLTLDAAPTDDPLGWDFGALAVALAEALPRGAAITAQQIAGEVLAFGLAEPLAAAADSLVTTDISGVRRAVLTYVTDQIGRLLETERHPQTLCDALARWWPLDDSLTPSRLRGLKDTELREALTAGVRATLERDTSAFLARAADLFITRSVAEALDDAWPADRYPGPWVLAKICTVLGERWGDPSLLHPSRLKGHDRDGLREALLAIGRGLPSGVRQTLIARETARAALAVGLRQAAAASLGTDGRWQPAQLDEQLAAAWIVAGRPAGEAVVATLNREALRDCLRRIAEAREPAVIAAFGEEPAQKWLLGRIDRALGRHCSLRLACRELGRRWPIDELDPNAYSDLPYRELRGALVQHCVDAARAGGQPFVIETSRMRLVNDVALALKSHVGDAGVDVAGLLRAVEERWSLGLTAADLTGQAADEVRRRVEAAAAAIDPAKLLETFVHETVRRRLRQSVEEAQKEHCNPDIAPDRWDHEAFVAALERQWPIAGRLQVEVLRPLDARELRAHARDLLREQFDGQEARFIRDTTRHQTAHGLRDVIAEHASTERLCAVLGEQWPGGTQFDPAGFDHARLDYLPHALADYFGVDPAQTAEVSSLVDEADMDFSRAAAWLARTFAGRTGDDPRALDEWSARAYLEACLRRDFEADPHQFVKAVALEDVPRQLERRVMLDAIDTNWCNHLEAMDYLREGINLRGYGQTDPFIAYRRDGRTMFENMLGRIRETVVGALFETTEAHLVEMHQRGRLGLRIAVQFENIQELAAKAEDLTASQSAARQERRRRRQERRKPGQSARV